MARILNIHRLLKNLTVIAVFVRVARTEVDVRLAVFVGVPCAEVQIRLVVLKHILVSLNDVTDDPDKKKSVLVTYRDGSLYFCGTEGSSFTVCDMQGRICIKGKASPEISVNNLTTGVYMVNIGGRSVKFFKK